MTLGNTLGDFLNPLRDNPDTIKTGFRQWHRQSKLAQIRYVAFLTAILYLLFVAIEYHTAPAEARTLTLPLRGVLLPLTLVTIGLMTYRASLHNLMWGLLLLAPIAAVAINLYLSNLHSRDTTYAPELYLIIVWIFTISGMLFLQAMVAGLLSVTMILAFTVLPHPLSEDRLLHLLWLFAAFSFGVLSAFILEKTLKLLYLQQRALERTATVDALTKVWNRYKIEECLEQEVNRSSRYDKPLSVILIDIDHFKNINDHYGHTTGDALLREFASVLEDNIRGVDQLGRFGGEEFLVILPETGHDNATLAAETLRRHIVEHAFATNAPITASFGVAQYRKNEPILDLINRVDRGLYRAKGNGRNRVCSG